MRWLIGHKVRVHIPGQVSKRNTKDIFLRRFPLSRFPAKTLRVNKPAMKKFLKGCSKIAKFLAKTTSHDHRSEDDDDLQRRSRFAQKAHNW